MAVGRGTRSLGLALTICLGSAACLPAGGPTGSAGSGPAEVTAMPELGLANVASETAAARGATIGEGGGTVSATADDGTTYRLDIPAGALDGPTLVALYPVSKLSTLPAGASLTSGVQFAPDGLRLHVPATLAITPPAGVAMTALVGLAWRGDGQVVHAYPVVLSGGTASLRIYHFSGAGVGLVPIAATPTCNDETEMETLIAQDVHAAANGHGSPTGYASDLETCYDDFLKVLLAVDAKLDADTNLSEYQGAIDAYDLWLAGIAFLEGFKPGVVQLLARETSESKGLAAALLRAWFDSFNAACIGEADQPGPAIGDAVLALVTPHFYAPAWGIDTAANRLDYATLLNDLCVQVVIDPSRSFSGSKPGDNGTVTVPVGYSIVGQAVRHDRPIYVQLTLAGSPTPFAGGDATAAGPYSAPLTWPAGVDPLRIDVLASLDFGSGLTALARFDRITKGAGSAPPPTPRSTMTPAPTGSFVLLAGDPPTVWTCSVTQVIAGGAAVTGPITWSVQGVAIRELLPSDETVQVLTGPATGTLTVTAVSNGQTASIDISVTPNPNGSC